MATNTEIAKGLAASLVSSALAVNATATNPINPQQANGLAIAEIRKQRRQKIVVAKAADAMASTTTAEASVGNGVEFDGRAFAVYFTPTGAGLTAHNTDYATITLSARTPAGGASVPFATLTTTLTSSGTLTQYVRKAFVLAAGVDVLEGSDVTVAIAKAGSGVVVPVGYFTILFEDT
jgi:hypothetical protein